MLQKQLINWYQQNKRDLPWRNTSNPYIIWLSEVILQQTRVQQGLPYFLKFVENYPDVKKLSNANIDEIMKLWQGLGYYSRARNMHFTAKIIVEKLNGVFPQSYEALLKQKGIGPYTAAAIASFAYNEQVAVLDGNVFRVLSRLFAIGEPINSASGKKIFNELAGSFLNKKEPAIHNQALMELGALVCKPQNPNCIDCPFNKKCIAYLHQNQQSYPVKEKKLKVKTRYFNYIYFSVQHKTAIFKREAGDIWQNLYDLPIIETTEVYNSFEITQKIKELKWVELKNPFDLNLVYQTKHILTHQKIIAYFWVLQTAIVPKLDEKIIWIKESTLKEYPISRLFEKFLQEQKLAKINEFK